MRSGRTTIFSIAFAFSSAAAFSCLHAADSTAKPAPASQPEKIEFSGASSTAPKIPRPGMKPEDLFERYGNVRDTAGGNTPQMALPSPTAPGPAMPSKAAAEKLMRDWDKNKNWLFPNARDDSDPDPLKQLDKQNDPEKELLGDRREGVMERFIKGEDTSGKTKTQGQLRMRDLDRDRDRASNKLKTGPTKDGQFADDKDKDDNDPQRDPNDNKESNGLADFNLKNFIRQQNAPNFLNNELPKANQLFRSGSFGNPNSNRDPELDRAKQRERDAARSAEFMQILRPRSSGFAGVNDPINSPDLTRREMNPITPQITGSSGPNASPFSAPPSPASRMQDNAMFGVTGPAASSIAPTVSAPLPRPEPRAKAVVIEPPRRISF